MADIVNMDHVRLAAENAETWRMLQEMVADLGCSAGDLACSILAATSPKPATSLPSDDPTPQRRCLK